jgi:hypothetical protein
MIAFGHLVSPLPVLVPTVPWLPERVRAATTVVVHGAVRFALVMNVRGTGGLLWRMRLPVHFIVVQQRSC